MKKYISVSFLFTLLTLTLSFIACSSDDVNTTYEDEAIVKEKIKGQWTVESMKYESNYATIVTTLNESSKTLLNTNNMYFAFKEDSLLTVTVDKSSLVKTNEDLDPYKISNGNVYINDKSDSTIYIYKYTLTDTNLILKGTLSRNDVVKTLEESSVDTGIDYSPIIESIPSDLSIDYSFILKR